MRKWGPELRLLTPFPEDPADPLDPADPAVCAKLVFRVRETLLLATQAEFVCI